LTVKKPTEQAPLPARSDWRQLAAENLWTRNPALVGMLGLCPLLAVSGDLAASIGLGLATLLVLVFSNTIISLLRRQIDSHTRLPVQIMVIASAVTAVDMLMQAWAFELHQRVGLFVALIVTNCILLGRAEAFASRQPVLLAALDGCFAGLGFLAVLVIMGAVRELLGQGTLLASFALLTGETDSFGGVRIFEEGFLLMALPPGAFLCLGFIIAGKNWLDARRRRTPLRANTARINVRQLTDSPVENPGTTKPLNR